MKTIPSIHFIETISPERKYPTTTLNKLSKCHLQYNLDKEIFTLEKELKMKEKSTVSVAPYN